MSWYVYMLRCNDDSLYTGVTTDLARRLAEHNSKTKGAKYTKARQPVSLVYSLKVKDRSKAQTIEAQLKKLPRREKLLLTHKKTLKSKIVLKTKRTPRQKPIL